MKIQSLTFNPFAENTYLMIGEQGSCLAIDPGMMDAAECAQFDSYLTDHGLQLSAVLLSHAHIDHVLGLRHIEQQYGLVARAHAESKAVYDACPRVAEMYGIPYFPGSDPVYDLELGSPLVLDGEEIEMRFVPGHAPGHLVFVDHGGKQLVAGDTLFRQSIGRTDLPGGDHELLLEKIRTELFTLADDYEVWPGHGPSTTIGYEKEHNPFLR